MFPDVYVRAGVELDLALRSHAASIYAHGQGALTGFSAAELLGSSCGPAEAPAELTLPGSERRGRPGLIVHRYHPLDDERFALSGVPLTTPLRTAYDLARRLDATEAAVAVDALAHKRFAPTALLEVAAAHPGDRRITRLPHVIALADPRSESPMETRIRVAINRWGLRPPEIQFPVGRYRLDLAYPEARLAVEYDGRAHLTPERARRDLRREADLTRAGWWVLRLKAGTVHDPHETAIRVHRELFQRGIRLPNVSARW